MIDNTGIDLIRQERERQIERWTSEHDDGHGSGNLARRAAELAVCGTGAEVIDHIDIADCWGLVKKHRSNRVRQLMIAGALIAAEIDRTIRKQKP